MPLHSSPADRVRLHLKKEKKETRGCLKVIWSLSNHSTIKLSVDISSEIMSSNGRFVHVPEQGLTAVFWEGSESRHLQTVGPSSVGGYHSASL